QTKDFYDEIIGGIRGFRHSDYDRIRWSNYSYLYTEPYEPIVHGTFDNQLELLYMPEMVAIEIIKDFFAEIMARDQKKTDYIERIQNNEKFTPTVAPVINIDRFKAEDKFIMFKSIYDSIKTQKFVTKNLKIKAINSMIKQAISETMFSEISKLRKIFDFTVIVIENKNISLENFLVEIRDLNIILNYLQEINRDDFLTLLTAIVEKK
ncbi:31410_t:CDS:2, partial [Racocetra persica]